MTAPAAGRPKFRIDPTAPPIERAPPPAPVAAAPTPPPAPPRPPAPAPSNRKRWIIGGAIVAALLVVGGAVAVFGFGVGGLVYPTKYLLKGSEVPHGLSMSSVDATQQNVPCDKSENPCKVSTDSLDQFRLPDGTQPKEAWLEGFDTPQTDGAPLTIVAMKFASEKEANDWVSTARSACGVQQQGAGALLQDGDVAVIVEASSRDARVSYLNSVVAALKAKAPLTRVC